MKICSAIAETHNQIITWQQQKCKIALIPTMGNLHAGHLSLIKQAQQYADRIAVTIFVNPLQFTNTIDLQLYPRTFEQDCDKLKQANVDLLFFPCEQTIYPHGQTNHCIVSDPLLSKIHCGASRPGHFDGVATIIVKLFNILPTQIAIFGEKDYQQLLIIRRVVQDLQIPIEIISAPIIRESDGLAMSSRNQYLNAQERKIAPLLYQTLNNIKNEIERGNNNFAKLALQQQQLLATAGFKPDYINICERQTLQIASAKDKNLIILAAAYLGKARLIDNIQCNI